MIKTKTLSLFYSIIIISFCIGQTKIGDWSALTCPLVIRDIVQGGDNTYCATGGGLMSYSNGSSKIYTTVEGLYKVDILSISIDIYNNIWLGGKSPSGFVQIYNIDKGNINIFDYGLTEITEFWIGDSISFAAFIDGQDLGIVKWVYLNNQWSYRDIYRNFPTDIEAINGLEIIDNTIFLATNNGLLKADILSNLKDPNNWSIAFSDINGEINSICNIDNGFILNQDNNLYKVFYENEKFQYEMLNIQLPVRFNKMVIDNDGYVWGINGSYVYSEKTNFESIFTQKSLNKIISGFDRNIIIGSELGLIIINNENFERFDYIPNSPITGKFSSIKVLKDGRLVGASSKGLSIKDFDGWRNILEIKINNTEVVNSIYDYTTLISDTIAYDFGAAVSDIEQGLDGLVYCAIDGTFPSFDNPSRLGGGILIIDIDDSENVAVIDTSILAYYTSSGSDNPYIVVKDIEFDREGNLWVANTYSTNKNFPIHVRDVNNVWRSYGSAETIVKISQSPISLVFDNWSRLWVSAFKAEEANMGIYPDGGIFVLEYSGHPVQPNSFSWESIIYNKTVWSVGMGNNNRLYYLTPTGLNYYDINAGLNPVIGENLYSYFPNISFGMGSKIKIDQQGNIWTISPTQGIHILLENTTYWPDINGLRASNSPLLSDEVYDLDFDYERKLAYIATSKGVNILRIPFGENYNNYNNIKIFPSPFNIPDDGKMIVDGLMYNSSMKILTLDGLVIRDVDTRGISVDGDQLIWDGKDNNGNYVSSGVYLLSIIDNGGNNTFSKITVIKK